MIELCAKETVEDFLEIVLESTDDDKLELLFRGFLDVVAEANLHPLSRRIKGTDRARRLMAFIESETISFDADVSARERTNAELIEELKDRNLSFPRALTLIESLSTRYQSASLTRDEAIAAADALDPVMSRFEQEIWTHYSAQNPLIELVQNLRDY